MAHNRQATSCGPVQKLVVKEDDKNPIAQLNEIELLAEDSSGEVQLERTVLDREMQNFELYLEPGKDIGHPRTIALVVDKDGQPYYQGKIQLTGK